MAGVNEACSERACDQAIKVTPLVASRGVFVAGRGVAPLRSSRRSGRVSEGRRPVAVEPVRSEYPAKLGESHAGIREAQARLTTAASRGRSHRLTAWDRRVDRVCIEMRSIWE